MSDIKSPFTQPPDHVPAEPVDVFDDPPRHEPDNVVGDTLNEVRTQFSGPTEYVPPGPNSPFITPRHHEPSGVVGDTLDEVPQVNVPENYDPTRVIGDTLDEVRTEFPEPVRYTDGNIIGDVISEVLPIDVTPVSPVAEPFQVDVPASSPPQQPVNNFDPILPPTIPLANINLDVTLYSDILSDTVRTNLEILERQLAINDALVGSTIPGANLFSVTSTDVTNAFSGGAPGSQALNVDAYTRWLIDIARSMGPLGVSEWIAKQTILYSMNKEVHTLFDPTYFIKRAPILNGITSVTLDTLTHEDIITARESLPTADTLNASLGLNQPGLLGSVGQSRAQENLFVSQDQTDGPVFEDNFALSANIVKEQLKLGKSQSVTVSNASDYFETNKKNRFKGSTYSREKIFQSSVVSDSERKLAVSSYTHGAVPVGFAGESDDGAVHHKTDKAPNEIIDDDDTYVPLSFTDLRSKGNEQRTVYFRPFITSFSEDFSPSWNQTNGFGAADGAYTYQSTTRNVSLGFDVQVFSAFDLKLAYKKLHWLTSLVYPEYDRNNLFKSGPVCRLRVGDMLGKLGLGINGIITSLSFEYTEGLWEITKDSKVVRSIPVTLGFTVLHDGSPGMVDGVFGVFKSTRRGPNQQFGGFREYGESEKVQYDNDVGVERPEDAIKQDNFVPVEKSFVGDFE